MTITAIYFIIALAMGAFIVYSNFDRDPDFKNDIRDLKWWVVVTIMALVWPIMVFQLLCIVIRKIINSTGLGL